MHLIPDSDQATTSSFRSWRLGALAVNLLVVISGVLFSADQPVTFPRDFSPSESLVAAPERPTRADLCLNGRWRFQPVAVPTSWKPGAGAPELPAPLADRWEITPIKIPSPWNVNTWGGGRDTGPGTLRPYDPSSLYFPSYPPAWDGVRMGWLARTFSLPKEWSDRRVLLRFAAIAGEAVILVNGREVGRSFDQHLPCAFDITEALKSDENELLVGIRHAQLFNRTEAYPHMRFVVPLGSNTDQLVGIWQDVWLEAVPRVHIAEVFVKPWVDQDMLELAITLRNAGTSAVRAHLGGTIHPWQNGAGTTVLDAPEPRWSLGAAVLTLPASDLVVPAGGSATTSVSLEVKGALKTWMPTVPNLYGAVLTLGAGEQTGDRKYVRFGWRQFGFKGTDLTLNGERIQCFGDLLHPFGPYICSRRFAWGWYKMIKDVGGNAVRPHAQPWPQCYYDLADEMGIVVLAEGGLFGSSLGLDFVPDEAWQAYSRHLTGLVRRNRNNPSVLGWSFGNELFAIFQLNNVSAADSDRWYGKLQDLGREVLASDPTRPWISCDGDEDLRGFLPVWSKHYGHDLHQLPELTKPAMIGESGGSYYASPRQMAMFNGDRSYESYAGRVEALAIDVYQNIAQVARPRLCYYSASELAWFGIAHLPFGWRDTTRIPDGRDGVFAGKPYEDGKPGMQLERIPPFVTTINPGWDPTLPLYRPLAMFEAMKAALAPGAAKPSTWDKRLSVTSEVPAAPPATITAVHFAGSVSGEVARRLRAVGVPFADDAHALLIVDGASVADVGVAAHAQAVFAAGGTVLLAAGAPLNELARGLLPNGVQIHERTASQLVPTAGDVLRAGLPVPALSFFDLAGDPQVIKRVVAGPGVQIALAPSDTDWSLFHQKGENTKCGAITLYEQLKKPAGGALVSIIQGKGRLVILTIDPVLRAPPVMQLWSQLMRNLGIVLKPTVQGWIVDAAATPNGKAEWRFTTSDPGARWTESAFDDGAWTSGRAGFGVPVPGVTPTTPWPSDHIWLRRAFELKEVPEEATLVAYWDEEAEVFINGVRVFTLPGFTVSYQTRAFDDHARALLKPGRNVIAVSCRNIAGGQFIDVGIAAGDVVTGGKQHDLLLDGPLGE